MRPKINGATCEPIKIKWGTQLAKRTPGAGQAGRLYFSLNSHLNSPAPASPPAALLCETSGGTNKRRNQQNLFLKITTRETKALEIAQGQLGNRDKKKEQEKEKAENESPFILIYLLTYLVAGSELRLQSARSAQLAFVATKIN